MARPLPPVSLHAASADDESGNILEVPDCAPPVEAGLEAEERLKVLSQILQRTTFSECQRGLLKLELEGATSDEMSAEGYTPSDRQELRRKLQRAARGLTRAEPIRRDAAQ